MARGRMITNYICKDKDVNNLSNDTCRLLFNWLITFADKDGRTNGDPDLVKAMVFPRREDITIEMVEKYLQELSEACLILLYECNKEYFVWFPGFDKNQIGLRKDREPDSEFPAPSDKQIDNYMRKLSGKHPDNIRKISGLKEVNGMEVNGNNGIINPYENPRLLPLWNAITGMFDVPGGEKDKVIPAFEKLIKQYKTDDEFISTGKIYYGEWKGRTAKDGRKYSKINCSWFYDWWVSGEIPEKTKEKPKKEIVVDDDGGMYL